MKNKKIFKPNPTEFVGKLVVSASGLRNMANALKKKYHTTGNVSVDGFIHTWREDKKTKQTIGIKL